MKPNSRSPFNFCGPLLESLADGVFAIDLDWRIRVFNRAAENITGIPREEAIGSICCEVFKASICETSCALKQAIETGKPVIDRAIFILNSDGQQIPISISAAVLRDDQGEIIGGVETFRDLSQMESLRQELTKQFTFENIISQSERMQQIFDVLLAVAESRTSVLITGESGTGKELTARAIHTAGPSSKEPFVAVNCGALPDTLLESELFGYRKGAFTDARQDKPGRFSLAGKGTIFLDEIGDISQAVQVKLLRVLEEGEYEPLGSIRSEKTQARIITATNRNLEKLVEDNVFREDLYYRI
ncbi:sigma 54-interacting transcriptional regulator, partial [bacterium]|nr:sigma 54-interacting transcriptional regulator [bacterium]